VTDAIGLVRQFFDSWREGAGAVNRSFYDHFTPETVWDNVGLARTTGPHEAVAFLRRGEELRQRDAIRVDLLSIAQDGNKILTERIDYLLGKDGEVQNVIPVMGILEIADEKITAWREYFDITPFRPPAGSTA